MMKIKELLKENQNLEIETLLALKFDIVLKNYDKTDKALKILSQIRTNKNLNTLKFALVKSNREIEQLLNSKELKLLKNY